jgi:hypothetical protein
MHTDIIPISVSQYKCNYIPQAYGLLISATLDEVCFQEFPVEISKGFKLGIKILVNVHRGFP